MEYLKPSSLAFLYNPSFLINFLDKDVGHFTDDSKPGGIEGVRFQDKDLKGSC